jgi:hypothetical protein
MVVSVHSFWGTIIVYVDVFLLLYCTIVLERVNVGVPYRIRVATRTVLRYTSCSWSEYCSSCLYI